MLDALDGVQASHKDCEEPSIIDHHVICSDEQATP